MSEATLAKLFAPFTQADSSTTRQYGGTGLGLSICRGIVALMKGSITVDSKLDVGTTFNVFVQFCRVSSNRRVSTAFTELVPLDNAPVIDGIDYSGTRVLVAEDNAVNQMVVMRVLKKYGITDVTMASNGVDVLSLFHSHSHSHFDFILME